METISATTSKGINQGVDSVVLTPTVPEPGTLMLFGSAVMGVGDFSVER